MVRLLLVVCCSLFLSDCAATQKAAEQEAPPVEAPPSEVLAVDPLIRVGTLENGLRFYIRENRRPENRAELRLVVNAGSVLEEADQQGLAHFAEHMAFNGTRKFPKQELFDYLELVGLRLGADLNAYTTADETVYMLQVPTDSAAVLEQGVQILSEWAQGVSFEGEEIDRERGVVIEEWRMRRGARARMRDRQLPILYRDSRYAERSPIGQKAVLDTFHHETLRRFYRDWYRPDLMAVVAVGDFDRVRIEELIRQSFSGVPPDGASRRRPVFPVPDHQETLFAIASDPEATGSSVGIYYKQDVQESNTVEGYRRLLVKALYNGMLNQRLYELTRQEDPPFLAASSRQGRPVRSKEAYIIGARVQDNGIERGLEAVLTEAARVQRYGFTQPELDRERVNLMRGMERSYLERDKIRSGRFASEYIRHFLVGETIPGIEKEYELHQTLLPEIELAEVNRLVGAWITDHNRVVVVNAPEKEGVQIPGEEELLAVMGRVGEKEILPYEEDVSDLPLVEHPPVPSEVIAEKTIPELGVTEWRLANGVRVVLKPTDFQNDQVVFTAFSPGGHSLVSDADYVAASTATSVVSQGGLGRFDLIALQKKLAGKAVRVSASIDGLQEGVSGSGSPEDLETMFQLIYLTFTAPRQDSSAFLAYRSRLHGVLENRSARPETAFRDTLQVTMTQYHHRARPWSEAVLDEMDLQRSFQVYRDRFADASDFAFFFVGNFEPEQIQPLVQTYLGGLPSLNQEETWRDVEMNPPKGVIEKTVWRGQEPKSMTRLVFTGPFEWNRQNRHAFGSMASAFQIKLREVLREDLSGTYNVGVGASDSRYPKPEYSLSVSFGCAPERVEELTEAVFVQIDSLKRFGLPESYIDKVKASQRRSRETNLKENGYWLGRLRWHYYHGEDPLQILAADALTEGLTGEAVKEVARRHFDLENYVRVVLYPEHSGTSPPAGEGTNP